jgi:FixJ family two-component response regulator
LHIPNWGWFAQFFDDVSTQLTLNSWTFQANFEWDTICCEVAKQTMTNKGHVFLVEDDQDVRSSVADVLIHLGYGVSDFDSATSFLQQALRCSPAVLILDMRMPKMTGLDLQKALIEQDWALPIIYMSGDSQSQEIIDAMKFGAIDFLWKPITHTQLMQVVDKGLKLDAQRHANQLRLNRVAALHQSLSVREQEILSLMLLGHGNKAIGLNKNVMADTVKKHRAQIMAKMEVNSLAELLSLCKDYLRDTS